MLTEPRLTFQRSPSLSDSPRVHLRVREIPIYGDLILSPMDGYSDMPFRLLCRELGSAMSYTEFVNVDALCPPGHTAKCPGLNAVVARKLTSDAVEHPMTFQIYGHDEDRLVAVALRLQDDLCPDVIDINMGCYVKHVAERGAGSGMLRDPGKVARVFTRLTRALRIPVTAKIRLGWDAQSRNYLTVARILEENGASLIAVHGRTKAQGYTGTADWDAIAEIKQALRIPVIGNGDVRTVEDIARIKAHTGCDAVMIGRAAVGNPWIFSRRDREQVTRAEKIALMRRHLALSLDFYGERRGLVLFRKHAYQYVQSLHGAAALRLSLMTTDHRAEFERLIDELAATPQNDAP